MGNYNEAIAWSEKAIQRSPNNFFVQLVLCSSYSSAGRMEEAHAEVAEGLRIKPKFSVVRFKEMLLQVSNTTNQCNNSALLEEIMRERCQKVPV